MAWEADLGGREERKRLLSLKKADKGQVVSLATAARGMRGMGQSSECQYTSLNEEIVALNSTGY